MTNAVRKVAGAAATALVFLLLSASARSWSGDLSPSPLWLATAAATAMLIAAPREIRPWVIVGSIVGGVLAGVWVFDDSVRSLLSPLAGNTAEMVIVAAAVRRMIPRGPTIRRTRDALVVIAIATTATAVGGLLAVADTASTVIGTRFESWWRWTFGDAIGQLLVLPLVLTQSTSFLTVPRGRHLAEIVASCCGVIALGVAAFLTDSPILYVIAPVVMWLAIRFGPRLTAPVALLAAISATAASGRGVGPFADLSTDPVVQVQLFNLSVTLCSLIGGAHAIRAERDHRHLAAVLSSMPDIVLVRDATGRIVDSWVPVGVDTSVLELAPGDADDQGIPMVDHTIPPGPRSIVSTTGGAVFERRTAPLDESRSIEVYRDVSTEQRALKDLRRRDEIAEDARIAEQTRIARAIHDSAVQLLVAAKLRAETVQAAIGDPRLDLAIGLVAEALDQLRGQIDSLMPPDVASGQVVEALEHLAHRILDPRVEVHTVRTVRDALQPEDAATLFLLGREAIANAARHAAASRITIDLDAHDGRVRLRIEDDGNGRFELADDRRRIGMTLMHERITARGGTMAFEQVPGRGTTVTFRLPTDTPMHAARA